MIIDPAAYELIPGRKYVHVVEIIGDNERTARWSRNMETGSWHVSEGWKRAGRRMTRADSEYAEAIYQALAAEAAQSKQSNKPGGTSATYTPRFTQLDRKILRYVSEHPHCTKSEAGRAGERLTQRGEAYRRSRVESLIERGLLRDEGQPNRASLDLTDEGRRALKPIKEVELDIRILLYIAEWPGCRKIEAGAAGDNLTRLAPSELEYRCWRVGDFIRRGLVRDEGRPGRPSLHLTDDGWAFIWESA